MNRATGIARVSMMLVSAGLMAGPSPVHAQDDAQSPAVREARARFAVAEAQFDQENFALAAGTFREVYEMMAGHPRRYLVLFNLGRCLEETGAYQAAADAYVDYLEQGGAAEGNAADVRARIQEMERRAVLTAGVVREPASISTEADTGGAVTTGAPDTGLAFGGVALLGVAVASFAVTGIFGGLALSEDAALAGGCGATLTCQPADIADAEAFVLASDVGLGIGAAAAVAGAILLILGLTSSTGGQTAQFEISPVVAVTGAGVHLSVRH